MYVNDHLSHDIACTLTTKYVNDLLQLKVKYTSNTMCDSLSWEWSRKSHAMPHVIIFLIMSNNTALKMYLFSIKVLVKSLIPSMKKKKYIDMNIHPNSKTKRTWRRFGPWNCWMFVKCLICLYRLAMTFHKNTTKDRIDFVEDFCLSCIIFL